MSYDRFRFTYGRKTTAQINALTNLEEGQSVWNTDLSKPEYVVKVDSTLLWCNEDCMVLRNASGSTMQEGHLVRISTATTGVTTLQCTLAITDGTGDNDNTLCGVVFRGGIDRALVVVAQQGLYNVLMTNSGTPTTTRGNLAYMSSVAGRALSNGPSPTTGSVGVMMQTQTNAQLVANNYLTKCMIQNFCAY